jgi:Fe-S-cluster containining protein
MSLPCSSCQAHCCGPTPLSQEVLTGIMKQVHKMPQAERERLHAQERDELTCCLLDVENNRCAVYTARPGVCRMFGRVPEMVCPFGTETPLPPVLVSLIERADHSSRMVMLSTEFRWLDE